MKMSLLMSLKEPVITLNKVGQKEEAKGVLALGLAGRGKEAGKPGICSSWQWLVLHGSSHCDLGRKNCLTE